MFPENIVQATFQQVQTYYLPRQPRVFRVNGTLSTNSTDLPQKPQLMYTNEMNVLGNNLSFILSFFKVSLFSAVDSV